MTWAPDYVTLAELKSYLRITDTADDVFLALWITTASRNVDDFCHRQFGQVDAPEARTYRPSYDRYTANYILDIDDLQDLTALTIVDDNALAVTGYTFSPDNALQKGKPYERVRVTGANPVTITASWGWTAVPSAVKIGLLLQAARLAARRDSPFGVAGSPTEGSELRLLAQLDPDFRTSLKPLRRDWWAA